MTATDPAHRERTLKHLEAPRSPLKHPEAPRSPLIPDGTPPVIGARVPDRQRPSRESPEDGALVDRIAEWLRAHYADRVTARQIGVALDRHPAYLGSVFHRLTGTSLKAYLTQLRMERAAALIAQGDKIEAVALCVGYRSKATFYRHFRQHFGMTPRSYRNRVVPPAQD